MCYEYPQIHLLSKRKQVVLSKPAQRRIYSISHPGNAKDTLLSSVCVVDGEIGYVILFVAEEDEFLEKMSAFEGVLWSLEYSERTEQIKSVRRQIVARDTMEEKEKEEKR